MLKASHRTEIGAEVLNDRWVSITSGSEDHFFKHILKTQYEEILLKCEDYWFELDKLLESIDATIKSVEKLSPSINVATTMTDNSFCIEDHLTVPPERREKPGVFLQRNKTKGTVGDEIEDTRGSMEGLLINNGLESKVDCDTMEVSYIAGSEDFMFRTRRRRKALYHKSLCSGASNGSHKLKRKLMFS
ncbi:paired amphipathic helix protein pst2-like isoform X2 [Primulina huaijiensis]|uniref:paired amphipathic helix protein pst2-like isoform X2 n=1 Tax=Primulina huaijiensis TaxID=1492673 RepID=UPI003CC6EA72